MIRRSSPADIELNVTAMLDMAFQLLAFFVLTFRPALVEPAVLLQMPPAQAVADRNATPIQNPAGLTNFMPAGVDTLRLQAVDASALAEQCLSVVRPLAQAIATRRGQRSPDEACILLAAITLLAYRRALEIWLGGPANADLAKVITKEFKLLSQQLSS